MLDKIYRTLSNIGGAFLLALAIMVTLDVIVRSATGKPFTGVFELSRLFLLMSFSLAIAPVSFFDCHLRVDIFSGNFTGRARTAATLLDRIATIVVFAMMVWVGCTEWLHAYRGSFLQPGIVEIPTVVPLGFLVFGSFAVCATILYQMLQRSADDLPAEPTDKLSQKI